MSRHCDLVFHLRKRKSHYQRRQSLIQETDFQASEILTYRIELINILLAEFGEFKSPRSLKNLLKRPNKK